MCLTGMLWSARPILGCYEKKRNKNKAPPTMPAASHRLARTLTSGNHPPYVSFTFHPTTIHSHPTTTFATNSQPNTILARRVRLGAPHEAQDQDRMPMRIVKELWGHFCNRPRDLRVRLDDENTAASLVFSSIDLAYCCMREFEVI